MRFARLALLLALGLLFSAPPGHADAPALPFLSPLFTDNMVLQRGQSDPVWGWTTPGTAVTVSVAGKNAKAVAGADGKWMVHLPTLPVGGPYTLVVSGPQTATLSNVLVGDVWLCSGQSNMEFGIGNAVNGAQEIAAANHPNIRLFMVTNTIATRPAQTVPVNAAEGHWKVCSPQTVAEGGWNGFSAVGYFFARNLQAKVPVPIGLIESDWGGTPAESWTSGPALAKNVPDYQPQLATLARFNAGDSDYPTALAAWWKGNDPGTAATPNWNDAAYDASAWKTMPLPQYWEKSSDPDLANFDGILWYRKTVTLPADAAGKTAVLHLGPVDDDDTTFVNGVQVGATVGFQAPRDYTLPATALKAGANVIAVRVLDTGGGGGIWGQPADMHLDVAGEPSLPLAGDWSYKIGKPLAQATPAPVDISGNPGFPSVLYNGMIAPLQPYGIKGALWYQGEANAGRAQQYQTLLPAMIRDWRTGFGSGDFPFLIVQLAGYQPGGDGWPGIQEAQMMTAQNVPHAGIVTAIDIGDPQDIHPKNKQEVGRRLALVAEGKVYGQPGEYYGPVYKAMTVTGSTARITFTHLGGGLTAKDGKPLTAFTVAGEDGSFSPADAKIDGDAVLVSASAVPHPAAVRYAWAGYPEISLYNKAGLPAFPFRTDVPGPPALLGKGPDLALHKSVTCSDPNQSGWAGGLTDGAWDQGAPSTFATGDANTFPKTATIDLEQPTQVGAVAVGVPAFGSTKTIAVSVSTDGQTFTPVGSYVFSLRKEEKHVITFAPVPARYVRLTYPDHYDESVNYPPTFVFTTEAQVFVSGK